jgi:hypothetical protein
MLDSVLQQEIPKLLLQTNAELEEAKKTAEDYVNSLKIAVGNILL